jgi:hypothetical protein
MKTLILVCGILFCSVMAFGQGALTIDCGGANFGHRGKLTAATKLAPEEIEQLKKADSDLAAAQKAHDAVVNKIKQDHGQTPQCLGSWGMCLNGVDVVLADDFALSYEWRTELIQSY